MKLANARSGFTILEVLIAMGILLFGMTTILGLLTYATALSKTAHLRTSAASAVQSVVANLEETYFPEESGEAGEPRQIIDRPVAGVEGLVYSAMGRANPDRPTEYRVDVAMSWSSQGVKREKRFTTILLREISFGERLRRRASPGATADPATKSADMKSPAIAAPSTDQPSTDQPSADQPSADQPSADQPGADQPGAKDPRNTTPPPGAAPR